MKPWEVGGESYGILYVYDSRDSSQKSPLYRHVVEEREVEVRGMGSALP